MNKNILLAGMGGQGLVLMTDILCEAALLAGYEAKSNDVVGLSQRGGMVWGNVRIGDKVFSPNIPEKYGDFLIALEPLEGLRWSEQLKVTGEIILNTKRINPVIVQQEKVEYPEKLIVDMKSSYNTIALDASNKAIELGKIQVSNVILIGILANRLSNTDLVISKEIWLEAIMTFVPTKAKEMNRKAFEIGYNFK